MLRTTLEVQAATYQNSGSSAVKKLSIDELRERYNSITPYPAKLYDVTPTTGKNYKPGKMSAQALKHTQDYINFMRVQAGLPEITLLDELNTSAQYGALVLAMLDSGLSHTPTKPQGISDADYKTGFSATSSSNISYSRGYSNALQTAISGQMDDSGSTNTATLGHRRWLLNPLTRTFGVGNARSATGASYTCVRVFGSGIKSAQTDYDFVAWPASGAMLSDVFSTSAAWSVTLNPAKYKTPNKTEVKVTLTRLSDKKKFTFDKNDMSSNPSISSEYFGINLAGYGVGNCIIFRPIASQIGNYSGEYEVNISGIYDKSGAEKPLSYKVNFDTLKQADGWKRIDGSWYYYLGGKKVTGWKKVGSKWYYMDKSGKMLTNTWVGENWLDGSGAWVENKKPEKWIKSGNRWWYRNADGSYPKSCWKQIGGKYYYFDAKGYAVTGWFKSGNKWYYMNTSCAMVTGWKKISEKWYYFNKSGAMLTGWQDIDGERYCFSGSGAMRVGWFKENNLWYYFDTNGLALKNQWLSGKYYFKADGVMAANEWVDNERYYVDENGVWVPGKVKDDEEEKELPILKITNTVVGTDENTGKVFRYTTPMTYVCTEPECMRVFYGTDGYYEFEDHQWDTMHQAHTIYEPWEFELENGSSVEYQELIPQYKIYIMEPEVDSDGKHYEVSYRINNGPLQTPVLDPQDEQGKPYIIVNVEEDTTLEVLYE